MESALKRDSVANLAQAIFSATTVFALAKPAQNMAEQSTFQPFTGLGYRLREELVEDSQVPSAQPSPEIIVNDSPEYPPRPPALPELCPVAGFVVAKEKLEEWITMAGAWSLMDLNVQLQGQIDEFVMTATILRSQFDLVDLAVLEDDRHMVPFKDMEQLGLLDTLMRRLSFVFFL